MNVMISCYALSCWALFCILTDSTLGVKGFSFFLIPDSSRRGLFAKKMQQNDVLFGIAVLPGNTKFAISFPGFSPTRPTKRERAGRREPWERGC